MFFDSPSCTHTQVYGTSSDTPSPDGINYFWSQKTPQLPFLEGLAEITEAVERAEVDRLLVNRFGVQILDRNGYGLAHGIHFCLFPLPFSGRVDGLQSERKNNAVVLALFRDVNAAVKGVHY